MNDLSVRDPFGDLFRGFMVRPLSMEFGESPTAPEIRLDVKETPTRYDIEAELPGMKREDIHVEIDERTVSISAERKREKKMEEQDGQSIRTERYFGKVARSFQLDHPVDAATASARFADGVLTLQLPKNASAQTKRIAIK